jgi:formylglycine-generating enzyme required for sulfatase activity
LFANNSWFFSDFYIGETEVTQKQWRAVMGNNPSSFKDCDDCPVERVSWNDIQDFLSKLNARSGSGRYRLPTEAEWEYAARGGAYSRNYAYVGSNDADRVAWYDKNSGSKTHPVKGKDRNELGLYDMSGNVREWCADCWHGTYEGHPTDGSAWTLGDCKYRVLRGGSWSYGSRYVRVSLRNGNDPVLRSDDYGFRLARTAP